MPWYPIKVFGHCPKQKNTFVKFDKLSPATGQDILKQGKNIIKYGPMINHNQIGLPCSDFNKGFTGNISGM